MIWLDTETFSETPINHGTYRYAADAEVMIVTYAFDDGPVNLWDVTTGTKMPGDLEYALLDTDDLITAHNVMFDRTILNYSRNLRVKIALARWRCTMVRALAHSLPGKLDLLCEILNVSQDKAKLKTGKELINLFCKPRPKNAKIRRANRFTHPDEWARFKDYATMDIEAMRVVASKLPAWNYRDGELALWHLDQRINDRGFCVDIDLAQAAIRTVERAQKALAKQTQEMTNDEVQAATQRDAMLTHILAEYGIDLPNMQKSTLERRVQDPDLPVELRELLAVRLQATTSSTSKYAALTRSVSDDARMRGTLQFGGANRTCRWAGRVFQPQNMPRPSLHQDEIDAGIEDIKIDCADLIHDNVMELVSNSIRGVIIAPKGRKLCVADLANIEGRKLAWLADEQWKLQAFRDYDTITGYDSKGEPIRKGPDLYNLAYARAFKIDPSEVTKAQRQIGKVMELALGYQGGVGAFVTFATVYGLDLEQLAVSAWDTIPADVMEETHSFVEWYDKQGNAITFAISHDARIVCDALKRMWRRAHPNTSELWPDVENACIRAVLNPGTTEVVRALKIKCDGAWLRIRLPSGRYLCYPSPRVRDNKLSYMGVNQYTRKWQRIHTYGGKIIENVDQASSRDVLAHGMPLAEQAGYELVLTVHDELITEAPDSDEFSWQGLARCMSTVPAWAPGLPLAAAGFEALRYRKD